MKTHIFIRSLILAAVCTVLFNNCGFFGGTPKVTLTSTTCKANDIKIAFENTIVMKDPGTPYIVQTVVVVTCAGEPLPDAEIRVHFPFLSLFDPYKQKTDTDGKITVKNDNIGSDPTGKSIEITIKGSDEEKKATLTLPAPQ